MKEKKQTEVAVIPPQPIEALMSQAIEKGATVETLERLMAIRREVRAEQAKEAFDAAMANFQGDCPVIEKKKDGGRTQGGQVAYKYAPLEDIVEQTKDLLKSNGFSYMIQTKMPEGKVEVTCVVKHEGGHSEPTTVEMPLSTRTQIMSAPQQTAATLTFAKRYAFCNAFGIMTGEADTDAQDTVEPVQKTRFNPLQQRPIQEMPEEATIEYDDMPADFARKEEPVAFTGSTTPSPEMRKKSVTLLIHAACKKEFGSVPDNEADFKNAVKTLTGLEWKPENVELIGSALTNKLNPPKKEWKPKGKITLQEAEAQLGDAAQQ